MSRPTVSKAKTSYPIFGATFANSRPSYLVVGGGGGGGRHGVKNMVTVFDFASRAPTVEQVAEIEASKDDSVTCLANLATKDGLIVYAGINGSEEERLKDQNEHLRAFEVQFPKRRASSANQESTPQGKISFLSKTSLFAPPATSSGKKEGYQRLLRLSPSPRTPTTTPTKRIGAIASSLAGDENEVIVFSATSNKPQNPGDVIQRIALHKGQEANDLDIFDQGEGRFKVAYATDYDVYIQDIHYDFAKKTSLGKSDAARRKLYTVPFPDVFEKKGRPKIRCLRWLSPSHILLLANKPNRTGVELLVLRLYEEGPGSIVTRKTLAKHVKAAVDMDVALLDPDSDGAYQIAIAVAAIDVSLALFTVDYHGTSRNSLSGFHLVDTYRDVHDVQMTKVTFSPFIKPDSSPGKKVSPQYLRLASTSLGNTISVETFELQPVSSKPKARYILQSSRSRAINEWAKYLVFAVIALSMALMIQSLIDPQGNLTKGVVPESLRNAASKIKPPGAIEDVHSAGSKAIPDVVKAPIIKTSQRISELVQEVRGEEESKAVVIHHDPDTGESLSTEVHADTDDVVKRHTEAKKWEELSYAERKMWKQKLIDAGVWAVEEGETILKGIFFSEAAGLVRHMAQGVIG